MNRQRPFIIGSVTTAIKRALVEMMTHGALRREKGIWKSCNEKSFFDQTITALVERNLAIVSVNQAYAGKQFVRLNEIGNYVACAVKVELDQRAALAALVRGRTLQKVPA